MSRFCIHDTLDLSIDLLGFGLLNKNITVMGLQQLKRHLANTQFFVLNRQKQVRNLLKVAEIPLFWVE
jgi:hypothetical protein